MDSALHVSAGGSAGPPSCDAPATARARPRRRRLPIVEPGTALSGDRDTGVTRSRVRSPGIGSRDQRASHRGSSHPADRPDAGGPPRSSEAVRTRCRRCTPPSEPGQRAEMPVLRAAHLVSQRATVISLARVRHHRRCGGEELTTAGPTGVPRSRSQPHRRRGFRMMIIRSTGLGCHERGTHTGCLVSSHRAG